MKKRIFTLSLILAGFSFATNAAVIHVPADQTTIQAAINAASEGDTVLVAEGRYYENLFITGKAITVASEFILDGKATHIKKTIIDGSQPLNPMAGSVVFMTGIPNSNATLKGLTLTGGTGTYIGAYNTYYGGAVLLLNNGAIIENNIIRDNSIEQSNSNYPGIGAGFFTGATLIIRHNKIMRNSSTADDITTGGGIGIKVMSKDVTLRISDNIISNNKLTCNNDYSVLGGGISIETEHSFGTDIQINNNTITSNELHSITSFGGGIYLEFLALNFDVISTTPIKIFNNVITNNYSQDKGGGLAVFNMAKNLYPGYTYPINPRIANNTFIGNKATDGVGIFNYEANLLLLNNILWDEIDAEDCREVFQDDITAFDFNSTWPWPADDNDGILYLYNNCIKGGEDDLQGEWYGENNIEAYPKVNPALFKLLPKSPCLGAGTESVQIDGEVYYAPDFDFYDNPRPDAEAGLVDMGAVMSDYVRRVGLQNKYGWQATKEGKLKSASLENVEDVSGIITIYPNPVTDIATISLSNLALITNIELVDVTGKVVQRTDNLQNNKVILYRNGLSKGIYLLRIQADKLYVKKIILK